MFTNRWKGGEAMFLIPVYINIPADPSRCAPKQFIHFHCTTSTYEHKGHYARILSQLRSSVYFELNRKSYTSTLICFSYSFYKFRIPYKSVFT